MGDVEYERPKAEHGPRSGSQSRQPTVAAAEPHVETARTGFAALDRGPAGMGPCQGEHGGNPWDSVECFKLLIEITGTASELSFKIWV